MAKDVLFEIGLEELPARFIDKAESQLISKTKDWLDELRISYDSITSFSTPRRLAVLIKDVAETQTSLEEEVKGPAVKIAKDDEGSWTKAAIGFTKGQGKTVEDIYTKEIKGTKYIFVKNQVIGKDTYELLPTFKGIIESIQFPKNMRWAEQSLRYARPIRWIAALYEDQVIPFEIADVTTSNFTFGHRFLGSKIILKSPTDYQFDLKDNYVISDPNEREHLITEGIIQIEKEYGFQIPIDNGLLNEVRNLVEYPTVFIGSYEESFLKLPSDVLIISMKEHQRYFPVKSKNGELLPYFVGVRNGDDKALNTVIKGNEKVLHARLSDAQFFFEEDQKHSIDYYLEKLERVVFQEKLGTISDKVSRVVRITDQLAQQLNLSEETKEKAVRAAEICKFDLPTNMVNEFTELQGIIGQTYALNFGEAKEVAKAVADHYLPVHADDRLPENIEGAIVSVADKLDTIVGCISVGLTPTGSQDPYGLRRQSVGILKILKENKWNITVESLLDLTQNLFRDQAIEQNDINKVRNELEQFFGLRATYILKEVKAEQDVIQSVLHQEIGIIAYTLAKASILSRKRNDHDFKSVQQALVRVINLSKKTNQNTINPDLFETPSEKELYQVYLAVKDSYINSNSNQQAEDALLQLGKLAEPIHNFFEHNMVMADDDQIRNNRLSLLNLIATLTFDFADLSAIEWKQQF
ncbi:glycyl-tRNA synthetase beta chain [Virgibacillus subterraneus]|uniref:Glycine--tRNA ligase beta subunit n=2 Tax=Virgibacillus TaxID=84406 RepID=A0A1H1BBA2_9BACI|nr:MULTISPECIES: glycine--tRNA ligase subunit beta [Virgibacillus]SDQ49163.1 glycyl-tRNA synthetase beta chain [Virgibacillus salinus]SEQ18068.1 glycyl-tRNA synthetase beta chain [Virgibacillus subterraneus]